MPGLMEKIKNEITFENVLMGAIKTPGVKINRDVFLRKELKKYYPEIVINEAIVYNPAKAGVPLDMVNKISKSDRIVLYSKLVKLSESNSGGRFGNDGHYVILCTYSQGCPGIGLFVWIR